MTSQEGGLAYETTLTPPLIIKVHLPSYEHLTRVCVFFFLYRISPIGLR
jgi:hypothetical protein